MGIDPVILGVNEQYVIPSTWFLIYFGIGLSSGLSLVMFESTFIAEGTVAFGEVTAVDRFIFGAINTSGRC
jgi:hypothetical protein